MPSKSIHQTSLRACIIESLQQGEMSPNLETALLAQNRSQVNQKDETEYWEYKEDLDLNNPIKVAQLNKTTLNGKYWAFKDDGREDIFAAWRAAESLV